MTVWLAAAAFLVALIALAVAVGAMARARACARLGSRASRASGNSRAGRSRHEDDAFSALDHHILAQVRRDLDRQAAVQERLRAGLERAVSRTATVRYDAFEDAGGRLSSSSALLDAHGTGVVFTSINGRLETRTYAKAVVGGDSPNPLSDEEREAIAMAITGSDPTGGVSRGAGAGGGPSAMAAEGRPKLVRARRPRRRGQGPWL